jgi:phage anti-repressor protein
MERKELIKITTKDGKQLVSARELHEFLEIGKVFGAWINDMIGYGFEENVDYTTYWSDSKNGNAVEYLGSPQKMSAKGYTKEYIITIDMAKELSMIQRTEKGKQARLYFIECEKQLKTIDLKANLLLAIYNGGQEGVAASKKLTEMEVAAATQPLLEENKELKIQTQKDREWFSIKRVAMINNTSWKNYKWKDLKNAGIELGYTVKKVFDANYGEVNAYHIDVWKKVYPEVSFSF